MGRTMRELRLGEEFAGYRVERELGRGGVAAVYAARHLLLDRPAALKVILPGTAAPDARERFVHESRVVAALDHPGIVPIYDAGELEGIPYIAMRYVGGEDLAVLLGRRGRLEPEQAVRVLEQVASALDAAHERGVVHRDVKPGNVLIERDSDRIYLTDFGIAASGSSTGLTQTGLFVGTPDYASPEQIQGEPVDGRADVYALAAVAYECLAGRRPYLRPDSTSVLYAHLLDPPPAVTEIVGDLPMTVDAVIATGLAKSPGDRYATCRELVDDLGAALAQRTRPRLGLRLSHPSRRQRPSPHHCRRRGIRSWGATRRSLL